MARTLESLDKQKPKPYEVVISDDSDIDSVIALNSALAQKYSYKYVRGPGKGLYANRNFVATQCVGTHIRTMDDDHEFPENHITDCTIAINKEPETIWTIGEFYPSDKIKALPAPIAGQLHPRGYSYSPKEMKDYYGISCGATIYPRSVVDRKILNFEMYKFGILYLEYGVRLFKKGYTIKPLDSTFIIHHYDENNRSVNSSDITNSAQVFSMLMLSFYHMKNFKNIFFTSAEIGKNLVLKRYPLKVVKDALTHYRNATRN
ncbi:glycosyltransferase involved in cell wall biosynthesis [Pontibacter sp. HSC-36F09]|nr:glycosyltransferase involved in cell wall biosynthesis [Pontibacter sp. HSC-36F09]